MSNDITRDLIDELHAATGAVLANEETLERLMPRMRVLCARLSSIFKKRATCGSPVGHAELPCVLRSGHGGVCADRDEVLRYPNIYEEDMLTKEGAQWVIWSGEFSTDEMSTWWCQSGHGYTDNISRAGRFTREEVERLTRGCSPSKKAEMRDARVEVARDDAERVLRFVTASKNPSVETLVEWCKRLARDVHALVDIASVWTREPITSSPPQSSVELDASFAQSRPVLFVGRPVLFVGEANPYGDDPTYALYDLPERASGHRLRKVILGLRRATYLGPRIERVNLCTGTFDRSEARMAALEIAIRVHEYSCVVLLGAKVRAAFGFEPGSFCRDDVGGVPFVSIPHPSGLSRAWNDQVAVPHARALIAAACDLPLGEADEP